MDRPNIVLDLLANDKSIRTLSLEATNKYRESEELHFISSKISFLAKKILLEPRFPRVLNSSSELSGSRVKSPAIERLLWLAARKAAESKICDKGGVLHFCQVSIFSLHSLCDSLLGRLRSVSYRCGIFNQWRSTLDKVGIISERL